MSYFRNFLMKLAVHSSQEYTPWFFSLLCPFTIITFVWRRLWSFLFGWFYLFASL